MGKSTIDGPFSIAILKLPEGILLYPDQKYHSMNMINMIYRHDIL